MQLLWLSKTSALGGERVAGRQSDMLPAWNPREVYRPYWSREARLLRHPSKLAPLALILTACIAFNPTPSNPLYHFVCLSYPVLTGDGDAKTLRYGKGLWDFAFVAFYSAVLTLVRDFVMHSVVYPVSMRFIRKSKRSRFAEQMFAAIYTSVLGPLGFYVMSLTPVLKGWRFDTEGMYTAYPNVLNLPLVKFYYLFQAAFWVSQSLVLVLKLEKPRKDHNELIIHHVVTLSLISASYYLNFVDLGLPVFVSHDVSDFFLASSKALNYLDSPLVPPYLALFVVVWVYMRHYINIRIIISLFTSFRNIGPWGLNPAAGEYKFIGSQIITVSLLGALQCLNLFWFFLILRVVYRYVFHNVTRDDRSSDEEGEEFVEDEEESDNNEDAK